MTANDSSNVSRTQQLASARTSFVRFALAALAAAGGAILGALLLLTFAFAIAYSNLPDIEALTDYQPRIPLRVWTSDGVLIGEFGEERRDFVPIKEIPARVKQAILAAEDDTFYRHSGVDYLGIVRAALANFASGRRGQGGSTITMQVARNFYLTSDRSYLRKVYEIALAYKIESKMSKDQILEVYANQIFLGQRAYGFAAAGQIYFGKKLSDLTVGEAAILAGLPAAPSAYNPWANPRRAKARQQYVLSRMLALGSIDKATYEAAVAEPIRPRVAMAMFSPQPTMARNHAEYAAEMARQMMFDTFRDETYSRGLNVYTTLVSTEQQVAYAAVRKQVLEYDQRHGYRGPESLITLDPDPKAREQQIEDALLEAIDSPDLFPAVVIEAGPKAVKVVVDGGETVEIKGDGLRFVARALDVKAQPGRRIEPGAIVRLTRSAKGGWEIAQLPQVEAAFVSATAGTGAIRALIGGFDFNLNKFNHVTQAWRQPGSSFKPFIYSAALEKGFMPSTIINDAPIVIDPKLTGGQLWDPKNYDGKYEGPMRLRQGLAKSKNLVSIRVLKAIGPRYARDYVTRFGFDADKQPAVLTMALGAGSVTPLQLLGGYAVFATGGYRVNPYLIDKVTDSAGKVLMQAHPLQAGSTAPLVIDQRNAYMMDSLMRDVARYGTAARASSLKREDVAGKTGTTNDSHDAWFAGYTGGIVAVSWFGYDQPRSLGDRETGGGLALPIWINYMATAAKNRPVIDRPMPDGIVTVGGEIYFSEFQPGQGVSSVGLEETKPPDERRKSDAVRDQIF